jgi:hypothetical protein
MRRGCYDQWRAVAMSAVQLLTITNDFRKFHFGKYGTAQLMRQRLDLFQKVYHNNVYVSVGYRLALQSFYEDATSHKGRSIMHPLHVNTKQDADGFVKDFSPAKVLPYLLGNTITCLVKDQPWHH